MNSVGIDVGGIKKGFHCVYLRDGQYTSKFSSCDAIEVADWCREVAKADVIAIDAPCKWNVRPGQRKAERELTANGIYCFATPMRDKAEEHRTRNYDWIIQGERIYQQLDSYYNLSHKLSESGPLGICFETYPHAITWQLRGGNALKKNARLERVEILQKAGIDTAPLTNGDWRDAGLCALVADYIARGKEPETFGDSETGYIVVPRLKLV